MSKHGLMSRREEAKEFNRTRIRAAAEEIIRTEGMEKLTMRRLADQAGVSLRTPYNLFGSKTGVLLALIEDGQFGFVRVIEPSDGRLITEQLINSIDRMESFFERDEAFYRDVYWGIMSSEQSEARTAGFSRFVMLCTATISQALENGELKDGTDPENLGRHLAIQLLAILGMWASGFFPNRECAKQTKRSWCSVLLIHCRDQPRPALMEAYEATLI